MFGGIVCRDFIVSTSDAFQRSISVIVELSAASPEPRKRSNSLVVVNPGKESYYAVELPYNYTGPFSSKERLWLPNALRSSQAAAMSPA